MGSPAAYQGVMSDPLLIDPLYLFLGWAGVVLAMGLGATAWAFHASRDIIRRQDETAKR